MNDQLLSIQIERADDSLLVRLSGEIDLSNSDRLHQQLENAVDGWRSVVIDLTEITYLDSQGLRLIKQLCNKANRDQTELQFVAPPTSFARQVLEMAQMSDYTEIRDTRGA
ncbi:MAG TPA: STAS domain-containing protein [Gaiellaceae bacterium]